VEGHFQLGRLTRKHGFKGNVVLKLDTDRPEAYVDLESFWLESSSGRIPFFIEDLKSLKRDEWVLKLEGVDTEADLLPLLGQLVWLPDSLLPRLEEHQFYYHELSGFSVVNEGLLEEGTVHDVLDRPGQPLLELHMGPEKRLVLVPCVDAFIVRVDREQRVLHLAAPVELFSL
jgi:16S rRNA processing protein RimM